MTEVRFYDGVEDSRLEFAVILSRSGGKWVLCKQRERTTLEIPGGRREPGEAIEETARRELREETGATAFSIRPVCVYAVVRDGPPEGGMGPYRPHARGMPGYFSLAGKVTKRAPGEHPRSPRYRPEGDTPFVVYLRSVQTGLILLTVPALRLPPFCVYPRVLPCTPCCGTSVRRLTGPAAQRFGGPLAGSVPLKGRQKESRTRGPA